MRTRSVVGMGLAAMLAACGGGGSGVAGTTKVVQSLQFAQCFGGGTTLPALQAQLTNAGITVLTSSCGNDGLAHITVCGATNGAIGIFEVPAAQSPLAQQLGFQPLANFPDASTRACP